LENAVVPLIRKATYSQEKLEVAILKYQDCLLKGNKQHIEKAYKDI